MDIVLLLLGIGLAVTGAHYLVDGGSAIAIGNQYPQQQAIDGQVSRQKSAGITFNEYSLGFNLS